MLKKSISLLIAMAAGFCVLSTSVSANTLELLTWKGYAPKVLVDKFKAETGIDVKVTFTNNEEMIAKLRATRGAGFDLAQPSQDRISSVQAKYKIYQPMDFSKIKTDQIVTSMLNAVKKNTMVNGKPHAVPFCWGTSGLIVNKKFAPKAADYTDLLNPAYKGRVSYRLKRPTLIAFGFALGDDPFAKYSDVKAYKALYKWINFILKPENAAVFTNLEKYGTASKGAIKLTDAGVRANFERSFSDADIDNIKWYPPVPAKLESIEGMILDKVKASK